MSATEFITKSAPAKNVWAYRIAIAIFTLFAVNSLCTVLLGALANADWIHMDGQGKVMLGLSVVGNLTGTLLAFISKNAKAIESGNPSNIYSDSGSPEPKIVSTQTPQQKQQFIQ